MVGAYCAYVVQKVVASLGLSLFIALIVGFLIGGLLGLILEMTLIKRMYRRPLDTLLVTFGIALILQQVARDIFGAPNVDVAAPQWLSGPLNIAGFDIPRTRIFIFILAILCVLALQVILKVTPLGRQIRATVENRDLAEASGISTTSTDRITFFLGSGLAGVAGVALTLLWSIGPTLGTSYIVDAFLVVVVGGIGQLRGAVIAAVSLGILQAAFGYITGVSLAKVLVFLLVVIFLQIRPQGLVAIRTRSLA
jgi:urea transport system permease protein